DPFVAKLLRQSDLALVHRKSDVERGLKGLGIHAQRSDLETRSPAERAQDEEPRSIEVARVVDSRRGGSLRDLLEEESDRERGLPRCEDEEIVGGALREQAERRLVLDAEDPGSGWQSRLGATQEGARELRRQSLGGDRRDVPQALAVELELERSFHEHLERRVIRRDPVMLEHEPPQDRARPEA